MMRMLTLLLLACTAPQTVAPSQESSANNDVVYGNDDRMDVYAHPDATLQARARQSAVALMGKVTLDATNPNDIKLNARTLGDALQLCDDQRFRDDPTAAYCSGTLIADDLVLTAGHCIASADQCDSTAIVFNYLRNDATSPIKLTSEDVFSCKELIVRQQAGRGADYGVIRLDRPATPRFTPAPVRFADVAMNDGDGVAVIGCGSGIPLKIDSGAHVRDARAATRDFFVSNTDTFINNSGSGVYAMSDYSLIGILVRGDNDYVQRDNCAVVHACTDSGCRGEDATYIKNAIHGMCDKSPQDFPNVCPPLPPLVAHGSKSFSVQNTNTAESNTANFDVVLSVGQTLNTGTCFLDGAHGQGDTFLRIIGPDGNEVINNDDTISMLSYAEWTAVTAGTYQVRVGCFEDTPCQGTAVYEVRAAH